jgi:hypothetical protein
MKCLALACLGSLILAGCVTVNLPEMPPYHPGYAQAETGAVAPAPPILDLSTAPPTASPGLPVPAPPDSEPGTIRSDEAGKTPMTGNIHEEHGMMQHGEHGAGQDPMKGMDHSKQQAGKAVYTCPMHPEVVSERPGNCPKCGMVLHKKEENK